MKHRAILAGLFANVVIAATAFAGGQQIVPVEVIYNNEVLFELRQKNGGNQALERFAIDNSDLDNDGVPDDTNVLKKADTEPAATINGGPNVYGGGWNTNNGLWGGPSGPGQVGHINGGVPGDNVIDNLVINNTFQIYDADGVFSFTENIDDRFRISVNNPGGEDHVNTSWNTRTYLNWNDNDAQGGGWYDIEAWSVEDGGGAGTAGGLGFGFAPTNTTTLANFAAVGVGTYNGDIDPITGAGFRAVLQSQNVVPEPSSFALSMLSLGIMSSLFWRRRRR